MFKKILLVLLCILFVLGCGCKKAPEALSVDREDDPSIPQEVVTEPDYSINPLTGLKNLEVGKEKDRPVAVTINNVAIAQPVQTGLGKADIVYETEVEGGITRLVAVYQDISKVEKIGTVRSARYAFIDLAMGHNAIYVHHGQDSKHAGKHLNDVDRFVVDKNNGGARISNGLNSEHTLYAYGDNLWKEIKNDGFKTEAKDTTTWQDFANINNPVMFENLANKISVSFSNSYTTTMEFDTKTGSYKRIFNNTERKDYVTKENLYFKNFIVLSTTIRTYPDCNDGKGHKEVFLESGDGIYFVNGTYTPIKWKKGSASKPFVFTLEDGTNLKLNPGNTWVCIADKNRSRPVIE